jgi:hypothetical protein
MTMPRSTIAVLLVLTLRRRSCSASTAITTIVARDQWVGSGTDWARVTRYELRSALPSPMPFRDFGERGWDDGRRRAA